MPVIADTETGLLTNIHEGIPGSSMNIDKIHLVNGNYEYYHYLCDGFNDTVRFYAILFCYLLSFYLNAASE